MKTVLDYTLGLAVVVWHLVRISVRGEVASLPE